MNRVILTGNLCGDPEKTTTQNGVTRTTFRIGVRRRYAQNGQHESDFFPVITWRNTADFVAKYLTKGRKVLVEGTLQTRSYDAQDGSRRYVTEINAENVEVLDKAKQDGFVEVNDEELPWEK